MVWSGTRCPRQLAAQPEQHTDRADPLDRITVRVDPWPVRTTETGPQHPVPLAGAVSCDREGGTTGGRTTTRQAGRGPAVLPLAAGPRTSAVVSDPATPDWR